MSRSIACPPLFAGFGRRRRYVLRWRDVIEPQLPMPGFIGAPLLRANVQFLGMVKEIERRHASHNAVPAAY
jgi:hypothetical protein